MTIRVICIGKLKESFYAAASDEFRKRLSRYCELEIVELADEKAAERLSEAQCEQVKQKEGKRILEKVRDGEFLIATAIDGERISSEKFARLIESKMNAGQSRIAVAIGGSLGLSSEVLERASYKLSFSSMTFNHMLFRIMLLEQLYRAFRIINNEPYHK